MIPRWDESATVLFFVSFFQEFEVDTGMLNITIMNFFIYLFWLSLTFSTIKTHNDITQRAFSLEVTGSVPTQ